MGNRIYICVGCGRDTKNSSLCEDCDLPATKLPESRTDSFMLKELTRSNRNDELGDIMDITEQVQFDYHGSQLD